MLRYVIEFFSDDILLKGRFILTKRYWLILIAYIIAQLAVVIIAPILFFLTPLNEFESGIYGNILSFIIGLIVILYLLRDEMKQARHVRDAADTGQIIIWSIVGVFMAYTAQAIAVAIEMNILGIKTTSENTELLMDITRSIPLFIIITVLIAPILEEIVFRKIIFGELYKRFNFFISGVISALIFGIIHQEPTHLLIYASMGFVLAFLYVKTKRIIVPIIVHMVLNSVTVILQLVLTPEKIEEFNRQLEQMHIFIPY